MKTGAAIELALELLARAAQISTVVANAQAQNRAELTKEEWDVITAADASARAALVDAIARAKAEGR